MTRGHIRLRFDDGLRFFLAARHRRPGGTSVPYDGTSTLGHVVQSLGVPLTEVGELRVHGPEADAGAGTDRRLVCPSYRPRDGETADVATAARPQPVPGPGPPRFLLDVHLGALARRLRLMGLDAEYGNDAADEELVAEANAGRRVLLTQDRGLLLRRALWLGAYVRGARPDRQLLDVLDRFAPPLEPWTRCMACNGTLAPVAKSEIAELLRPGTRRTYDTFVRCRSCSRLYWRGAHSGRLESLVADACEAAGATGTSGMSGTVGGVEATGDSADGAGRGRREP
ncbi:Mut7-C ubiquitin/RNAse domain-containing protein [Streptomyces marispadix]|uniref:Mut7-C ubiquitin/RNAse domain-containing protein n=1 Tax=Streptomyces marispadix TaxID=2922868 RepID=A0ABS9STS9_9ACTN|nr:Mut7-C ubiquitin/RNAse domain-containing protein [Streptomyces marispadix]MCH6159679.1 Mut7-C ubiquitin/RNAse domain-containing protein [Streptomyces marispadix]